MTLEELKKYSKLLASGVIPAQAADMARGILTGKGQSWMPNSWAEKFKGIKNPSVSSWWKAGKLPFNIQGNFLGAKPTMGGTTGLVGAAGILGFMGANSVMDSQWADNIGLGRNDFENYGSNLYSLFNQPSPDITALGGTGAKGNIFNKGRIDVNKRDAFTGKQLADSLAMDAQLAYNQVPNYPTGPGTVISGVAPPGPEGPAGFTHPPVPPTTIRSGTSDAALAQIQANIAAAKEKSTVLPKPVKATPLSGPAGGPPVRNRTQSSAPVFKSYGPPNRQRY